MDDITQHSNKQLHSILRNPSHPMHSAAKAERDRRLAKREDNDLDEINLKDLSKKIAQSSGNKNLHKAMKKSKDKTTSDLAAMRKRLDALKAGYAAESVELEEGVIDQVKDIVAKKQAKKISGVMVDMFTASAISQIYDKVNDANKAKMDKLPITKLADVAMKMMKRESVELDEAVNVKGIQKAVDDGKSMDVIMTMFANKRTTNTDQIRKVVKDYMWKKRMKKESVDLDEDLTHQTVKPPNHTKKYSSNDYRDTNNLRSPGRDDHTVTSSQADAHDKTAAHHYKVADAHTTAAEKSSSHNIRALHRHASKTHRKAAEEHLAASHSSSGADDDGSIRKPKSQLHHAYQWTMHANDASKKARNMGTKTKRMNREEVELDEAKIISTKPHPGGGHIVKMKTDGGQTVTRHLKSGKVKTMKVHKESVELEEARWEYDASTYMVGGNLRYDDKLEYKLSKANAAILNKYMKQAKSDAERSKVWSMFWDSKETGNKPKGPEKAIAYAKNAVNEEKIDEVLDTPKAMQSYLNKNKASADRAASSAAAKILRGKDKDGNRADHSPEVKTRDKRAKGAELANRNATRKTFNRLRNEMTEGGMKRMATTQSNKADRMASGGKKGLETFKKKPADLKKGDTVVPNKGPHKGHPHTIIHDFGDGHYNISPDNLTARQIKYSLGAAKAKASDLKLHKEEVQEASKEGTIRIIDLGRMGKGKGFQVQRMTKGKFVDQGKPYKSQKDAEKVRKDGQHSMQFEAAPKVDPAKFAAHMARHDKPKKMTSTQKSLADIRKKSMNEKYKLHHKTMSAALQHAYDEVKKKGYEIDKDDIDNKVAMGPRKPSSGKTNSYSLGLSKNGKPVKQKLHIQVYNMDNKGYELNMYVS